MIEPRRFTGVALFAALFAWSIVTPALRAQNAADPILDKLVDKGILTAKEANAIRGESDDALNRVLATKTGAPDWVSQIRIYGDVRGRAELFRFDNDTPGAGEPNKDRDRYRYRMRVGSTVEMKGGFELGFRLTSSDANSDGTGGDPLSGNTTLQNNGSKKFVYVDTAYGRWTPFKQTPGWLLSGILGKMENPFVASDMVFDPDYTPEGAALQAGYDFSANQGLRLNGGVFLLDEINQGFQANKDPALYGVQLRYDAKWTPKIATSAGVSWYALSEFQNLGNAAVPNIQVGNSRYATATGKHLGGDLIYNYEPIVFDASVTFTLASFPLYPGPFPIRFAGEYMENPEAERDNYGIWGGMIMGKAGKAGTWEISYRYKRLEADAQYEEFVDSDFGAYRPVALAGSAQGNGYRSGTGVRGHIVKATYSVSDSFALSITYFLTDLIEPPRSFTGEQKALETSTHRVQLDALWRF